MLQNQNKYLTSYMMLNSEIEEQNTVKTDAMTVYI